ncbi:MAG: hypothetical protein EA339_04870 [Rhodobacteraceae bacterium]|nr:MAG: hypothetical protein EA339_04870 [Paracoccaceae bacterium]
MFRKSHRHADHSCGFGHKTVSFLAKMVNELGVCLDACYNIQKTRPMPLRGFEQVDVMRIVCPNCNAQYEIDAALLPPEGREVQCSGCGTVWFQSSDDTGPQQPVSGPEQPPEPSPPAPSEAEPEAQTERAPEPSPDPELAAPPSPPIEEDAPSTTAVISAPKAVDEKVLGILREEAAFESRQRERDKSALETQPQLGILGASPWPSTAPLNKERASVGAVRDGHTPPKDTSSENSPAFPDIDDISATLEPMGRGRKFSPAPNSAASVTQQDHDRQHSGFLRGLILPIALAVVLMSLYLAAPALSRAIPVITPVLAGYVMVVDGLRDGVAGLFGR